MKKTKTILTAAFMAAVILVSAGTLFGQTKNDAIAEYNQGAQLLSTDPEAAVVHFEKCKEIASQLGEEGQETLEKAEQGLNLVPGAFFKMALADYKNKDFDNAIANFEKTVEMAAKYGDEESGKKAQMAIPQLYWAKGNDQLRDGDYTGAVENYNKAIELNPGYAKAYLNRGLAYKEMDDLDNMKASMDKAMELSVGKDEKTASAAEERVRISYFNAGVIAIQNKEWSQAESYFSTSIEYGNNDPDIYLKLGEISNQLGNYDKAIQYLNQGLGLVDGDAAAKAGFYYHMGNSYKAKNELDKACEAYKNAMYGDYLENAKYQVETELKCK